MKVRIIAIVAALLVAAYAAPIILSTTSRAYADPRKDSAKYYLADGVTEVSRERAQTGAGCSTRSRTWVSSEGLSWRATASGCWNRNHTVVTDYHLSAAPDGNDFPYRYDGIQSRETTGTLDRTHIYGQEIHAKFSIWILGVWATVWKPWARFLLDSYGNWDIHGIGY